MARKVNVVLTDDLDEEVPADETICFAFEGREYEIDLTVEHAEEMRSLFARYIASARKTGRAPTRRRIGQ